MQLGIDDLAFATADRYLDLANLAPVHGVEVAKYTVGLGQDRMSVCAPDEDVVTLAAAAALPLVEDLDEDGIASIRTVLLATESGIDQSKSAGVYVHRLLGLSPAARVVELKQACYAGTSALQMALALVARNPEQKVLVICSDVARYDVGSSGEPTQGCGAVAMLVTADPRLVAIEPLSGLHTSDVMDFWRPNYRTTAVVDGRLSIRAYTDSLTGAWQDLQAQGGPAFGDIDAFVYHQPFTKMATKAHAHLTRIAGAPRDAAVMEAQIADTLRYNREIGNSYTASMYIGLASLLDHATEDLAGSRIGFFSYGSGAVGEMFTGVVQPGYRTHLRAAAHRRLIDERVEVTHPEYLEIVAPVNPVDGGDHTIAPVTRNPFRMSAITGHQRVYERTAAADAAVA
ncbi:hydroxymethylglutaryl-CoA synthase [Cellulomonas hominis]|uniref:hydroxymethylglutaryl-CoA synthase n=1 Tax=Cellulomonas hominis TaxID=156981 RepID=UPI001B9B3960|nr:hydroxymethylglutaryl-CoA synthase [Cellulomonas hominis]VTR76850.1 Hydroxymethylglutaryl-CoA synthase [Cellulomonas hominis]